MKWNIILALLLLTSLFLRTYKLGEVPNSLQADEASFVLNSEALLETGRDEDGVAFPLVLASLQDSKPALYSYIQAPFFAILGVSTFSSRLPSAILGVFSIYLGYLLILRLSTQKKWSVLFAFLLTISPWHIVNSRATQEVILSFVFLQLTCLASIGVINWMNKAKARWDELPRKDCILFFVFALLSMYTYHASKVFIIMFYTAIIFSNFFLKLNWETAKKSMIILLMLGLTFALTMIPAVTRFNAISILSNDLPKAQIFEYTTKSTPYTNHFFIRLFYNKPVFYTQLFLKNYLAHFDPNYYFVNGGVTKRFMIPSHGLFYGIELPLMLLGLTFILRVQKSSRLSLYWLFFLLASPIAAGLTTEEIPSSIRAFYLVIPLLVLVVLGVVQISSIKSRILRRTLLSCVCAVYVWSFGYFVQQYFIASILLKPIYRSRHYEIAARKIKDIEADYTTIVVTDDLREMYIYLWLNNVLHISDIQDQPMARYTYEYSLGKFHFNRGHCDMTGSTPNTLIVSTSQCSFSENKNVTILEEINFEDGTPALRFFQERNNLP